MLLCLICLIVLFDNSLGNSVSQDISPLSAIKGSTVTIKCSYSTSYSNFVLPWYRHKPQESLEFLLLKYWDDDGYNLAGDRFSLDLKTNQKSITLTIKDLQLSDSAVYYCGLRPFTGTTEKMIFGKGTKLTVNPKGGTETKPSVFLLTSSKNAEKPVAACLAKGFYPKAVKVFMSSSDTGELTAQPVLSSDGKYSVVKFLSNLEKDVNCSVEYKSVRYYSTSTSTSTGNKPETSTIPAPAQNVSTGCDSNCPLTTTETKTKLNLTSMTILGLRILLAKSVAFNVLMTMIQLQLFDKEKYYTIWTDKQAD
ncbi:T cell receptor alpha chain MC.7.G5-like [Latimeria chalumnae]|uniref:T cell receptor alpha chain MC.7.G5-like n=1 Tax=Latimeria chalumnae TaxID=7897 RepID=UPI00313B21E9